MSHLTEFEGKPFQSVAKGALDLDKIASEEKTRAESRPRISSRDLLDPSQGGAGRQGQRSAGFLATDRFAGLLGGGRVRAQCPLGAPVARSGQNVPASKPHLELNPQHPLVARLKDEVDAGRFGDWTHLLFEQAMLAEGATGRSCQLREAVEWSVADAWPLKSAYTTRRGVA